MDYKKAFIKNLKEYRKQNNLTQDDLAEMLGYSQKNIAKWEQGYSIPSIDVVIELSKKMKISLDDLFGLKEKVLLEQCVDYILNKLNLDENEVVEVCVDKTMDVYETLGTQRDLIEDSVYSTVRKLVQCVNKDKKKFKEDFYNLLYNVNGKKRDKLCDTDKLFLDFFKSNSNIIDNENELAVSDELINECFDTVEDSFLKVIETQKNEYGEKDFIENLESELKKLKEVKEKYFSGK